jgi:hypothetical protein
MGSRKDSHRSGLPIAHWDSSVRVGRVDKAQVMKDGRREVGRGGGDGGGSRRREPEG